MNVVALKKVVEEIPYDVLVDFIECSWMREDCQITWNTDNDIDDLETGCGNTYSVEYYVDGVEYEGYFVVNIDDGCGGKCTTFFHLEHEVNKEGG